MSETPQSFDNHAQMVPGFHYVTGVFVLWYVVWAAAALVHHGGWDWEHAAHLSASFGLVGLFWYSRSFANRNQDRIIRLEERLRMHRVLPDDLKPHIDEYTTGQLVALRFASDAELPELARRVRDEGLTDGKVIKGLIRDWRADHHRV